MSKYIRILLGALRSNTVQINGILAAIWLTLYNSDLVQQNPEYVAIMGGIQAVLNILLRAKTNRPLSDR